MVLGVEGLTVGVGAGGFSHLAVLFREEEDTHVRCA